MCVCVCVCVCVSECVCVCVCVYVCQDEASVPHTQALIIGDGNMIHYYLLYFYIMCIETELFSP